MPRTAERPYKQTHPWLTFEVDLQRAGAPFWMMLGEARSKVDHVAYALLKPEVSEEMLALYLAKGVHATTAIEGNTLSESEVLEIVEGRADPAPSREYQVKEVKNIVDACNSIASELLDGEPHLTPDRIKRFNRQVLDGLKLREGVIPGEIRNDSVVVGGYLAAPAADCEFLLDELCSWLAGQTFEPPEPVDDWRVPFALVKAIVAHLYVAWIHPFGDGNGRTARLIELQVLLAAGVPMPAAHLLSNHYNQTRTEYYRQLEYASESGGDILEFLRYAARGFIDGIRAQVARVWEQLYQDRWEQYVYETFGRINTAAQERRRELALELSKRDAPVPRRELPRMSIDLATAYARTERMLSRDLNALDQMGLVERVRGGRWRAKKEQILGFQPERRAPA